MIIAMICNRRVIDIIECDYIPTFGNTPNGCPVTAVSCDDTVSIGMTYDPETNTFAEYIPPETPTPEPTQLDKIQSAQLTIMAAMADQYEESLEKDLRNMDVQATIYEAILELGGAE